MITHIYRIINFSSSKKSPCTHQHSKKQLIKPIDIQSNVNKHVKMYHDEYESVQESDRGWWIAFMAVSWTGHASEQVLAYKS